MSRNSCATNMPIAAWVFPTAKWKAGSPPRASAMRAAETIAPRSQSEKLTVKLWLATAKAKRKRSRGRMSLEKLITDPSPLQVSFEFSPPKTDEAEASLWTAIRRLEPLAPSFVSVTYGAGGSTRERTHATVKRIVEETSLKPAAHLTCVGASRGEIDDIVRGYWDAGIRHIVALRGDMPGMDGPYQPHPDGYRSTPELIAGIQQDRAVRSQRLLLSRAASGFAQPRP